MKPKTVKKTNTIKHKPKKTVADSFPENWQEIILELSAKGASEVEIRAELCMRGGKFSKNTWTELKRREEELKEVIEQAHMLSQAWWERTGRENLKTPYYNVAMWCANMNNRFGWQNNVNVKSKNVNLNGTPDDDKFFDNFFGLTGARHGGNNGHGNNGHGNNGHKN